MEAAIATVIRATREQLGYSQYRLADELVAMSGNTAVTREQVSRWERGKRVPGPYWRRWLAAALGVSPCSLDAAARYARALRAVARSAAPNWLDLLARKRQNTPPACMLARTRGARWWSLPVFYGGALPWAGKTRSGGVQRLQRRGEVPKGRGLLNDPVAAH